MLHKALDLAFKAGQFDVLQQIATNLDTDSDPALSQNCAEYFVNNQQFEKAVDLVAVGKKYKEAINICLNHNVQLTEELVEKLTPDKDIVDEETKVSVLENLPESLMMQVNYHLATKKYTQAGDRLRAMKALLKSGDTDKIIFFVGVSRQREIYIMAANYLQSLDWQNQPEILRNIITFYSKGKALDLLANFYVACSANPTQHQRATEVVQKRVTAIKRFIDIRRLFERGDTEGRIAQCRQFLVSGGQDLEESVRRGDVYALMIQRYIKVENYLEAKQLVGELRQVLSISGNVPISYYLNIEVIEALARGLGVASATLVPAPVKHSTEGIQDEVEIEEEVEE